MTFLLTGQPKHLAVFPNPTCQLQHGHHHHRSQPLASLQSYENYFCFLPHIPLRKFWSKNFVEAVSAVLKQVGAFPHPRQQQQQLLLLPPELVRQAQCKQKPNEVGLRECVCVPTWREKEKEKERERTTFFSRVSFPSFFLSRFLTFSHVIVIVGKTCKAFRSGDRIGSDLGRDLSKRTFVIAKHVVTLLYFLLRGI